jgi:F0F1-type ATP synthase delta subunit
METAYAQALFKMIDKGSDPKKAVVALHEMLVKRGRQVLLPRIAHAFSRIAMRERARSGMTLVVADAKDEKHAATEAKKVLTKMGVDHRGHIEIKVDESLVGGWVIEGDGRLIDASYKKQLMDIYNAATK